MEISGQGQMETEGVKEERLLKQVCQQTTQGHDQVCGSARLSHRVFWRLEICCPVHRRVRTHILFGPKHVYSLLLMTSSNTWKTPKWEALHSGWMPPCPGLVAVLYRPHFDCDHPLNLASGNSLGFPERALAQSRNSSTVTAPTPIPASSL